VAKTHDGTSLRFRRALGVLLAALALSFGCDDVERSQGRGGGGRGGAKPKAAAAAAATESSRSLEALVFKDDDFVESLRNRDPFRSYTTAMRADAPDEIQRRVVMPTTAIEEMRLIAIVTGMPQPKAMLVDPRGTGYTVQRGDYVGRPKIIQATGSVSMTLNWRVDRIRDNEVVLTQQDPSDPTRSALTKIIALNEEVARK
jgi:type IV pilus assembly protein PilP